MIIASALYDREWNKIHEYSNVSWYEKYLYYQYNIDEYKDQIESCDFGLIKLKNFDIYVVGTHNFIALLACKNYNAKIAYKFLNDYIQFKTWGDWTSLYVMIDKVENVKSKIEELKQETIDHIHQIVDQGVKLEDLIDETDKINVVPIRKILF